MYNSQDVAYRIKLEAKKQNITIKDLLKQCDLSVNVLSNFAKGQIISCFNLAKIADVLNVSTDYLLGRSDIKK